MSTESMALLIDNDQYLSQSVIPSIVRHWRKQKYPCNDIATELRETIEDMIYDNDYNNLFVENAISLFVNNTDWYKLAQGYLAEYVDNIKYTWNMRKDNHKDWIEHITFCQLHKNCKWFTQ